VKRPGLAELLEKYGAFGPRYTSYPPATRFHEGVGDAEYRAALESLPPGEPLSIYIHVPFCERRCAYCGCHVVPSRRRSIAGDYLERLFREMDLVRGILSGPVRAASVHVGGGTPTYLDPPDLARLLGTASRLFAAPGGAEVSVEVDPRVTSREHLEALRAAGVSRLSIGVQDTSEEVQAAIGRFQGRDLTLRFFDLARSTGFERLNADLVYGLPLQTLERFRGTLADVAALRPARVAVFGYAHVPSVRPNQGAIDAAALPGPVERIALFLEAHGALTAAGYEHIGLDHFALPGDALAVARARGQLGRTFMGYVPRRDESVIGFGASAIGDLGRGYFQDEKRLWRYFERIDAGALPTERGFLLDADDAARRFVIQEVLCRLGVDHGDFAVRHEAPFKEYFEAERMRLDELARDGLIDLLPGRMEVTAAGRLFLRSIAMTFDASLRGNRPAAAHHSRII
jgi:oxygen-independent coproporphyrinogen-3 oxidase